MVSREPDESFFGWLCSVVPGYPDTQQLKAMVRFGLGRHDPSWS